MLSDSKASFEINPGHPGLTLSNLNESSQSKLTLDHLLALPKVSAYRINDN